MQDIRWKALWLGISLIALCQIIWLETGLTEALITLSAGLLLYIAGHIYWLNKLQIWLKNSNPETVPSGFGVWEDIFSKLFQNQRKHFRTETELVTSLEGFKQATNALPDGIVVLNRRNEIEWCNPPAEAQLGLDLSHDANQVIHNFVRYGEFINYLQAEHYGEPIQLKSIRNSDITLQLQLIPFGVEQKLLISRDVSAQEKTDIIRRDFIANVSHELRTPLTVVGGFLETLTDTKGVVSDSSRRYFDMMIDQTNRMRLIIEDLLTLSRIESNSEAPEDVVIKMTPFLNLIKNDAIALSNGKHKIHMHGEKNLNLKGSREELLSAFSNLVSNAIRYTPAKGDIYIDWQADDDGKAVFSVMDTGIGIEQQHIERITERFYRVDRGRSRDTGGTGLGLAIVKHILSRHKAKLEVESEFGVGSTFSIIFPLARTIRKTKAEKIIEHSK
ncbi:MAG: phosphate regulon sensor histidine kinase PhoR [Methylophilaceae bacterium]